MITTSRACNNLRYPPPRTPPFSAREETDMVTVLLLKLDGKLLLALLMRFIWEFYSNVEYYCTRRCPPAIQAIQVLWIVNQATYQLRWILSISPWPALTIALTLNYFPIIGIIGQSVRLSRGDMASSVAIESSSGVKNPPNVSQFASMQCQDQ